MNNGTALLPKQETLNPEYVKVEAMAYRYGMTLEQYAIALATKSKLPEPKSDEEIFADIRRELDELRAKVEGQQELTSSIDAAVTKLGWLEIINREEQKFLYRI